MISRAACVLGIVVAVLVVVFVDWDTDPDRVQFALYDEKVLASAKAAKKPVVVYVTAAWDAACQAQNRGALKDPKVAAALEPFTRLKLDVTNKGPTELMLMNIDKLPTFTFSNHEGRAVARLMGTQNPEALVEAAKKATAP